MDCMESPIFIYLHEHGGKCKWPVIAHPINPVAQPIHAKLGCFCNPLIQTQGLFFQQLFHRVDLKWQGFFVFLIGYQHAIGG